MWMFFISVLYAGMIYCYICDTELIWPTASDFLGSPRCLQTDLLVCFAQLKPGARIRSSMKGYHIAVIGATGAAGTELLHVLERRNFPLASLRAIGSARSIGKSVR